MDKKAWLLSKMANKAAKIVEVAKSFSSRKAPYDKKIEVLKEKLLDEYKFWSSKTIVYTKNRIVDIEKDTVFIKHVQNRANNLTSTEKDKIDQMMKKYSITI